MPRFYEKTRLPFSIFLDADSGGRYLRKKLTTAKIPEDKIVYLGDIVQRKNDFELEDLFSSSFYHIGVRETYPDLDIEEINGDEGKITKHYDRLFKEKYNIGFSKHRVGETLKRLLGENRGDDETKANLQVVVNKIMSALQHQIDTRHAQD